MALSCPPNCIKGTPLWELYDVSDNNPEFCLYESVVMEFTDIAGFPVMYYRAKSKLDKLYGEDANQNYYDPVKTKLYYQPSEEPNIIDAFGLRSDETLQYSLIPKGIFSRDIGAVISGIPSGVKNAFGGTGYIESNAVATTGGTGTGLRVDIKVRNGVIYKIYVNSFNPGSGYAVNDNITISTGDGNATFQIASITTKDLNPIPGDVIKTLWNNRNYEIVDIGAEQSIFQGKKLVWEFILRPYRFSEQSLMAEQIHRSKVVWNYIYIYPDGMYADITYSDGTAANMVPLDQLDIDSSCLDCGYKYKRNEDGSVEMLQSDLAVDADGVMTEPGELLPGMPLVPGIHHETYLDSNGNSVIIENKPSAKYGDDSWIEVESNKIDTYSDVDTKIFGF
jgi:hypothetical protein